MPGFDGTGPRGMGSMTGGGRGYCSQGYERRGFGSGRGRQSGGFRSNFGFGGGRRRGFRGFSRFDSPDMYAYNPNYEVSPEEAKEDLKAYISHLEKELKLAKNDLTSFESETKKD
jgi:hypothetical protein